MLISCLEHTINLFFSLIPRPKPLSAAVRHARLIAHRGAHDTRTGLIENTMEAFKRAEELAYWGIEFDVRVTKDNQLVVHHDPDLSRLWGHAVEIKQVTLQELNILAPKIPSLKEVVSRYGGKMHLFIELKTPFDNQGALLQTLSDLIPCKDYHLLSLDAAQFKMLIDFPKPALLLVPIHNNAKVFCELSLKEQYGGVLGNYVVLTNGLIRKLQAQAQATGVGFVDSKYSLYRELNRGIGWLFTNKAEKISQYFQDLA